MHLVAVSLVKSMPMNVDCLGSWLICGFIFFEVVSLAEYADGMNGAHRLVRWVLRQG